MLHELILKSEHYSQMSCYRCAVGILLKEITGYEYPLIDPSIISQAYGWPLETINHWLFSGAWPNDRELAAARVWLCEQGICPTKSAAWDWIHYFQGGDMPNHHQQFYKKYQELCIN